MNTITIHESQNTGNTFTGIIMAAFNLKDQRSVKMPCELQHNGCGTVEIDGIGYDWVRNGETYKFFLAA